MKQLHRPTAPCAGCLGVRLFLLWRWQAAQDLPSFGCPVCFRGHSLLGLELIVGAPMTRAAAPEPARRLTGPEVLEQQLARERRAAKTLIATCKQRRRARIRGSRG